LRSYLQDLAAEKGIRIVTGCCASQICPDKVVASLNGEEVTFQCDSSISAVGFLRNSDCLLLDGLTGKGIEVKCLGPDTGAGHIMEATRKGYLSACSD
jgi:hypothetical protein